MVVGEALWRTERECLWLEILLCCGSWWASERSWSSCNKRFLQSIQHKSRQGEEAGAGLCWVSWSLKSHFSVCVCVCCRRAGNVGAGAFGMCEWAIPPPPVHGIVIPWTFHGCPREQRGQRMPQNAQNSVIWGGGVVSHLLQWKTGDSQTSLLFPEALGVEKSKALVVFQVGKLSPRGGSCIPQEELGEGQSCSWPGWSC